MGGCQNYGPFLGTLNIRCRIILGTQKGTIILTTTHVVKLAWGRTVAFQQSPNTTCLRAKPKGLGCSFSTSHCSTPIPFDTPQASKLCVEKRQLVTTFEGANAKCMGTRLPLIILKPTSPVEQKQHSRYGAPCPKMDSHMPFLSQYRAYRLHLP